MFVTERKQNQEKLLKVKMFINDKDITYINNITDKLYQYKPFIFVLMKKKKECMLFLVCMYLFKKFRIYKKNSENKKITKLFYITKQLKV